jgi:hypothetical protein
MAIVDMIAKGQVNEGDIGMTAAGKCCSLAA